METVERLAVDTVGFASFLEHLACQEYWSGKEIAWVVGSPHKFTSEFNTWVSANTLYRAMA